MAGMWSASFVFGLFVCVASSQQIYLKENNDCFPNEQTMLILKDQINFLRQENAREINSLRQENAREINSLRHENARKIDSLTLENGIQINSLRQENAREINSLRQENARKIDSLKMENARIKEEFDSMLTIFKNNISDSEEDLKSSILKIIVNGVKDCNDLYINGITKSGVYKINPSGVESKISVFCDMMVEGGGWTTIQKRVSGAVRFNKTWTEYKAGFGNPKDSYWIGNDVIHQLTKGGNSSLYVSITLTNGTKLYELYNTFSVGDESDNYRLLLGGPVTGTLGDRMLNTGWSGTDLSGMSFSTLDRDHDRTSVVNCAVCCGGGGGWWYNACHRANLNGPWSPADWFNPWRPTLMNSKEINETLMMIKPH